MNNNARLINKCIELANSDMTLTESSKMLKQEFDLLGIPTIDNGKITWDWQSYSNFLAEKIKLASEIKLIRAAYLGVEGVEEEFVKPSFRFGATFNDKNS